MIAFVTLLVMAFFSLVMFLVSSRTWDVLTTALLDQANKTGVYASVAPVYSLFSTVMLIVFVLSLAGAIIAYILQSHKQENEEYQWRG